MKDRQRRAQISCVDRLEYAVRSRGAKVVVLALVANTMVAQLLYNCAGQLVLGNGFLRLPVRLGDLLDGGLCPLRGQHHLPAARPADAGRQHQGGDRRGEADQARLLRPGRLQPDQLPLDALLPGAGLAQRRRQLRRLPARQSAEPWNWLYYAVHAAAYTLVLFLAGIYGERPKSAKEVMLATQRALEQQALERWKLQKEAQIEQMMRRGEPLGAVAAALASPETAERIAVLEAATSGKMSALQAARLNVRTFRRRHGHARWPACPAAGQIAWVRERGQLEVATSDGPFAISPNGSRSHS